MTAGDSRLIIIFKPCKPYTHTLTHTLTHLQILDATNTTRERRQLILDTFTSEGIEVMFIESVLNDTAIEEDNIRVHLISAKVEGGGGGGGQVLTA